MKKGGAGMLAPGVGQAAALASGWHDWIMDVVLGYVMRFYLRQSRA